MGAQKTQEYGQKGGRYFAFGFPHYLLVTAFRTGRIRFVYLVTAGTTKNLLPDDDILLWRRVGIR
jgi:hypothetical protein